VTEALLLLRFDWTLKHEQLNHKPTHNPHQTPPHRTARTGQLSTLLDLADSLIALMGERPGVCHEAAEVIERILAVVQVRGCAWGGVCEGLESMIRVAPPHANTGAGP